METLRKLIDAEIEDRMQSETMDLFLEAMSEVRLKNKELLIAYGSMDTNLYVVKEGVIRFAYFDEESKDKTFAFALPGTVMICNSFYLREPSFFNYESCGESVVMKITKADFEELLRQSEDFERWLLRMQMEQVWDLERKAIRTNGTAKQRFNAIVTDRPELLQKVSTKTLASYIGISQQYMSTMKNKLVAKSKKQAE
jgi:CRP-like cAMP-binding protein